MVAFSYLHEGTRDLTCLEVGFVIKSYIDYSMHFGT